MVISSTDFFRDALAADIQQSSADRDGADDRCQRRGHARSVWPPRGRCSRLRRGRPILVVSRARRSHRRVLSPRSCRSSAQHSRHDPGAVCRSRRRSRSNPCSGAKMTLARTVRADGRRRAAERRARRVLASASAIGSARPVSAACRGAARSRVAGRVNTILTAGVESRFDRRRHTAVVTLEDLGATVAITRGPKASSSRARPGS